VLWARAGLIGVMLALASLAALTTPFTWQADAVTAAAFIVVLAGFGARLRTAGMTGGSVGEQPERTAAVSPRSSWVPWAVLVAVAAGWELFTYLSAPRHAHPTLSSVTDLVTGHPVSEGLLFFAYLALGWYLARR
jgi:hypothetical protein